MNIETFQQSFQVREINYKSYLLVVSIFISILLIIVLLNDKLEDYYISSGKVVDNNKNPFAMKKSSSKALDLLSVTGGSCALSPTKINFLIPTFLEYSNKSDNNFPEPNVKNSP